MKTCRCRNLLFIQLPQVLLMINQNQPYLHGDVQNSVAVFRRLTTEFRASSGFLFFPFIFLISFSKRTSAFCLLLLWLRMLESIWEGERGRSMIYLDGNEIFRKFGSTHPFWRQDVLLAGATPYLLSFLSVSCFCICISADSKRKDLFFLVRNKPRFLSKGFLYCLIYLMNNNFTSFTWRRAAESQGIKWDVWYGNDSSAHCLCGWIECID